MGENKYKSGSKISKEEFLAQFGNETVDMMVKIRLAWKKGRVFPKIGDEYLAHFEIQIPWRERDINAWTYMGTVHWYCKKKTFGYPFPPKVNEGECYRIRVRKCIAEGGEGQYLLEEILEKNVHPENDSTLYNRILSEYLDQFEEKTEELLIYNEKDVIVKKEKFIFKGLIGVAGANILASEDGTYDLTSVSEGKLLILHDNKQFKDNQQIVLKKGTVYKVVVRKSKEKTPYVLRCLLERIVEAGVKNDELVNMAAKVESGIIWNAEGIGDFKISRNDGMSIASTELEWGDTGKTVDIDLESDMGSHLTANKCADYLRKILAEREDWQNRIFNCMVDETIGDDGLIEIWEGGDDEEDFRNITKEEFIKRISISYISISLDGMTTVYIDLDDMYTDHCYWIDILPDGEMSSHGLLG